LVLIGIDGTARDMWTERRCRKTPRAVLRRRPRERARRSDIDAMGNGRKKSAFVRSRRHFVGGKPGIFAGRRSTNPHHRKITVWKIEALCATLRLK